MRALVGLLALSLFSAGVGSASPRLNDVNPLLEEIIYTANQDAIKNHKDTVTLSPFVVDGLLYRLTVKGGRVSNLASLTLRGDQQTFDQTDKEDYSLINYDLRVGLEEIDVLLDYEYSFLHFFKGSGSVRVSTSTDTVRAVGSVKSYNSGECHAVLDSAELTEIGDFIIEWTPNSFGKSVLNVITSFVANHIVPHAKGLINKYIVAGIVKNEIPKSDFSKIVCKPLVV